MGCTSKFWTDEIRKLAHQGGSTSSFNKWYAIRFVERPTTRKFLTLHAIYTGVGVLFFVVYKLALKQPWADGCAYLNAYFGVYACLVAVYILNRSLVDKGWET